MHLAFLNREYTVMLHHLMHFPYPRILHLPETNNAPYLDNSGLADIHNLGVRVIPAPFYLYGADRKSVV